MRGLLPSVVTALLLGSTLAWATWLPKPSDLRRYAYITLEPSSHDSAETPEPIFLRVQVNPSGLRCEDASVTLQEYDLLSVTGQPEFYWFQFQTWNRPVDHPDGRWGNFTAGWAYDCPAAEEPDTERNRTLLVTIGSVGGVVQPDLDFAVHFRQGSEPEILSISGPKHHIYSGNDKYDHEARRYKAIAADVFPRPDGRAMPSRPSEFYSEVGLDLKVESAKKTPEMLGDSSYFAKHVTVPTPAVFTINMMEIGQELRDFQETYPALWRRPGKDGLSGQGDTHETSSTTGHREQDPLTTSATNEAVPSSSADSSMAAFSEKLSSLLGDQDLVTVLGAAAVFFGILSLLAISFFHRRLVQKAEEDNSSHRLRWWHSRRRRETVFERLARRANRRHARVEAAKAWFRAVFGRLFSGDVEKEAMGQQTQQQQQQQLQPQPQPLRQQRAHPHLVETVVAQPQRPVTVHVEEEQTTMEQELAQFRAAASMVGDLIAAEEGRSRRNPPARPVAPRHRSSVSMESEISDCDTLPTYEESAPTGSVISDGFGFMPGSSAVVPSSSLEPSISESNNSDRLGYNK